ncbi:unnamed protein product, partial [Hapterophycus canaliculatus]
VSSPHLARSYHHLFPVPQFEEVSATAAASAAAASAAENGAGNGYLAQAAAGSAVGVGAGSSSCAGCLRDLSELPRYRCPECKSAFCLDCDMYVHDSLHNCPGCC